MKNVWKNSRICVGLLLLIFAVWTIPALGQSQSTGLVLTNSSTQSNNPFLWLQDGSNNTGLFPILEVSGGVTSSTLGIEVTSQSVSTTGTAPSLSTIMPAGYGGLSLVQMGAAATGGPGQASPAFAMCANQYGTAGQGPDCWYWQVTGGAASTTNPPDTLQLTRLTTTNTTNNITVLFPASVNLATAANGAGSTAGQITVGPAPYGGPNANVPSTFTGAGTSDTTSAATAGPVTVEPGQLLATTPNAAATEGALQILQSYKGSNGTGFANSGRLACPDPTAAQSVILCASTGQAENWVGVYDSIAGQTGGSITPLRYGRVGAKDNSGTATQWTNGNFVCKDDSNAGYVINSVSVPCNSGESIGIAVGDPATTHTHLVDLVPAPSVAGGALLTFYCMSSVAAGNVYMFRAASSTSCSSLSAAVIMQPSSFAGTIRNLEVFYGTAPGTGITDTFTVYKCPALGSCAATSVKCSISGAGTPSTCSDITNTVSVSQGDGIRILDAVGTGSVAKDARVTIEIQ